jgi:RecA-family ATPase
MTGPSTELLNNVLSRLEGVKQIGPRFIARCPAHQDRSPSLSLSQGVDGRVLIHCHAGCQTRDVLAAIGLELRDLFPGSLSDEQRASYRRTALEKERQFEQLIVEAAKQAPMSDEDIQRLGEAHARLKELNSELAGLERAPREAVRQVGIEDVMSSKLEKISHSVNPWMPRRHVTLFGGHGGIGKSSLALAICAHVACGRPFAGMQVEHSKALFVSLEDEPMIIRLRLRRIIEAYNLPPDQVLANMRVVDGTEGSAALLTEGEGYGAPPVFTAAFSEVVAHAEGMGLIVIDNASDAFDANENSRRDVRSFIKGLAALARKQQAAVVLLAHIDKAGAKAGSMGNSYSGSTAWHNSTRSRLALLEQDGQIVLKHEKANLGSKADPVAFEFNEHGVLMPATACPAGGMTSEEFDQAEILRAMRAAEEAGIVVRASLAPGAHSAMKSLEPLAEYSGPFAGKDGGKRASRALAALIRSGRLQRVEYTDSYRNKRERLALAASDAGINAINATDAGSGKSALLLPPIPPSAMNAALGGACVRSSIASDAGINAINATDAVWQASEPVFDEADSEVF